MAVESPSLTCQGGDERALAGVSLSGLVFTEWLLPALGTHQETRSLPPAWSSRSGPRDMCQWDKRVLRGHGEGPPPSLDIREVFSEEETLGQRDLAEQSLEVGETVAAERYWASNSKAALAGDRAGAWSPRGGSHLAHLGLDKV